MSGTPSFEPRRAETLAAELRRRAEATLGGSGHPKPVGPIAAAMLDVAARIGEEVAQRLDRAPLKQEDNFFTAMGIGRDPARPARVPIAFTLADPAPADMVAPRRTRLMAESDGGAPTFETERTIRLAPGSISAVAAMDASTDAVLVAPDGIAGGGLAQLMPPRRFVRSGAGPGAAQVEISPASGIAEATVLRLGAGETAREYRVTAIEGELATLDPPLETALQAGDPAADVTTFVPFGATSRNRQAHRLYLGHKTLLDVPSSLSIAVAGAPLPEATLWSWWGKTGEEDPPAWQPLVPSQAGGRLQLHKEKGKPVARDVGGKESLWLCAELPGPSSGSVAAQDIRLAIADAGLCETAHEDRCGPGAMAAGFEAIANTTPIVPNRPFHPFGREPRLLDSFYVGCAEAFSKKHAEISLCFALGGPELGPPAGIEVNGELQVFGVGTDSLLYRGRFTAGGGELLAVPHGRSEAAPLPSQAAIAARRIGGSVYVAIAAQGEVRLVRVGVDSRLEPGSAEWVSLTAAPEDSAAPADQVALTEGPERAVVHARFGGHVVSWSWTGGGFQRDSDELHSARELIALDGSGGILAVVETAGGGLTLMTKAAAGAWALFASVGSGDIPAAQLSGWAASSGTCIVLAGYDPPDPGGAVRIVRVNKSTTTGSIVGAFPAQARLPLSFEPAASGGGADPMPDIVVALETPRAFRWRGGAYHETGPGAAVGRSDNPYRRFVRGGAFEAVQAPDLGLLYRPAPRQLTAEIQRAWLLAAGADVPATAAYATIGGELAGSGYAIEAAGGDRLLREIEAPALPTSGKARFWNEDPTTKTVTTTPQRVTLDDFPSPTAEADIALFEPDGGVLRVVGLWHLTPSGAATGGRWIRPSGFPDSPPTGSLRYRLLLPETADGAPIERSLKVTEVAQLSDPPALLAALQAGPLRSLEDPTERVETVDVLGTYSLIRFPHRLLDDMGGGVLVARLTGAQQPWAAVGPTLPANPALSWEYWNGHSWWALDAGALRDRTANLLFSGGVFFKAPADMAQTDVGGRTSYWIRARLTGGDYGEARVKAVSAADPTDPSHIVQTIERDLSTVRAPYITALKVGYCAQAPVAPEIVLTEDSLGIVDRTAANDGGMRVPVFTPVAELMNPLPPKPAQKAPTDGGCEEPCPPPDDEAEPDPCDAPGAADRCDSPCLTSGSGGPSGGRRGAPPAGFTRGLLLAFDKAFTGDPVTLYADVERGGTEARVMVELFRNGRFEPVELVEDTSFGLSEPGTLALALGHAPDMAEFAGRPGYWLRISPVAAGAAWAPRLRGLYLNAVDTLSIETRTLESLGRSSGIPDQRFRLSLAPVAPESLALKVRETVSEVEARELRVDPMLGEMPGPWVAWTISDDLAGEGPRSRCFALDPETGILTFGDGRHGAIPPPDCEIVAAAFAHVVGGAANAVVAGGTLSLVSPLAGVDKVTALAAAAGGSDVEPAVAARHRAPAKLRHGGRPVTLADLEDFALAFSPQVAQARAERRGGAAARLVVAARGADPRPSPALLRALTRAVREEGIYGLRCGGGFTAVAPALLPMSVGLALDPDRADAFPDLSARARAALLAFFDPATGGADGSGWRLGALPDTQDVAAALAGLEDEAEIASLSLQRAGDGDARDLPGSLPSHALVTLAAGDIRIDRASEAAA